MMPPAGRIEQISLYPLTVGLAQRFTVSSGSLDSARLGAARVTLDTGHEGWGEMAPFPAITGETPEGTLEAAGSVREYLLGSQLLEYRRLFTGLKERLPEAPAARCGLETAILDAFSRSLGLPLWAFLGGADLEGPHVTDITIPVTDPEATVALSLDWHRRGFRRFKLKIGVDADLEIEKISRVALACPAAQFILDANAGYELSEARRFLSGLRHLLPRVALLEQPLAPLDFEGASALRAEYSVPVAADESARSAKDVVALAHAGAADVINVKIMKSGLQESIQMALVARALGLRLMIGGMMETRLAMGCSFALVLGLGGFEHLDLDTPLLLTSDPWAGGFSYQGPTLLPWHEPGLGVRPREGFAFLPCEPGRPSQP